jgi:RNA recognition motif-containing protein
MGSKLYVGNLSFKTTEAGLREVFEAEGWTVKDLALMSDRETGRPRGFGFVTLGSDQEAQAAIAKLDGFELDGRRLRVNEAQAKPAGGGGGGGRGFGGGGGGGGRGYGGGGGGGYGGGGRDRRY